MLRPIERIVDNMAMDIEVPEESDDDGSGPSKDRVIGLARLGSRGSGRSSQHAVLSKHKRTIKMIDPVHSPDWLATLVRQNP